MHVLGEHARPHTASKAQIKFEPTRVRQKHEQKAGTCGPKNRSRVVRPCVLFWMRVLQRDHARGGSSGVTPITAMKPNEQRVTMIPCKGVLECG